MSTQEKQNDNLLVKLAKKSIGLRTGSCCSTSTQEKEAESCCSEQPSAATETSDCGCSKAESPCCCEEEKQTESKTA